MTRATRVTVIGLLLTVVITAGTRPAPAVSPATDEAATVVHVLNRVTFGARPEDIARVRAVGLTRWLEQQLDPGRLPDNAVERQLAALPTLSKSIGDLQREYARPDRDMREKMAGGEMTRRELLERYPLDKRPARITAELEASRLLRAVHSERQLQGGHGRFLVQPLQRLRRQGPGALVRDLVRARRHPPPRARKVS